MMAPKSRVTAFVGMRLAAAVETLRGKLEAAL
jgi:hypothetical protein